MILDLLSLYMTSLLRILVLRMNANKLNHKNLDLKEKGIGEKIIWYSGADHAATGAMDTTECHLCPLGVHLADEQ